MPPGVNANEVIDGRQRAPLLSVDPFGHYLWHVKRAKDNGDTMTLRGLAFRITRYYLETYEPRRLQHGGGPGALIGDFQGWSADDVATFMTDPRQTPRQAKRWVREIRFLHERDPETGEPVKHDALRARIATLRNEGFTDRAIAEDDAVTVSKTRVRALLEGA